VALRERAPDGSLRTWLEQQPGETDAPDDPRLTACDLAVSADGTAWLLGDGQLARFRMGEGYTVLQRGTRFTRPRAPLRGMELGPDGALYYTPSGLPPGDERVMRLDPVDRTEAVVVESRAPRASDGWAPAPHSPAFTAQGELVYLDARSRKVGRVPREGLAGRPYMPPSEAGEPE
jgi:hypothetical protein